MIIDTLILSRIQFAFTVGFHIIFPTINLGLSIFLAIQEALYLKTKQEHYRQTCRFWSKIFALTFGMGIVTGIVMAYELGTNFNVFTHAVGPILGTLLSYEVLSAFFLEAGFLGVMLFGWDRVTPKLHFFATLMVAAGTTVSAFWIMSANSWMQFPTGYSIVDNQYMVASWAQAIFNPLFISRLIHMVLASYVTCSFVVLGIAAWYLIKRPDHTWAKRWLRFALFAALIVTPLQVVVGDILGVKIYQYQPIKTAAMEGNWQTMRGAPAYIFALPDSQQEKNTFAIGVPKLASLFNTHDMDGELIGLTSVAASERPNVPTVFFSFRIMVGIGLLFFAVIVVGCLLYWRKRLETSKAYLKLCVAVAPLGLVATIFGWITSEVGRQPWVVFGLMRTSESYSLIPAYQVVISLTLFLIIYGTIFGFYLYYLFKVIRSGLQDATLTGVIEKLPEKDLAVFTYMTKQE